MKKQDSLLPFTVFTTGTRAAGPLFKQLYQELRGAILTVRLKAGTRLPSTRDLASDLGVSGNTALGGDGHATGGVHGRRADWEAGHFPRD